MNDIIKVKPFEIKQTNGKVLSVEGIRATMLHSIKLNAAEKDASFHFTFLDSNGQKIDESNASRATIYPEILSFLIQNGIGQEEAEIEANNKLNQIISSLGGGTDPQIYSAMSVFASSYGYELLPIEEQDGILVYPQSAE